MDKTLTSPHPDVAAFASPRKYPLLPPDREIGWLPYLWLVYLIQFWAYGFMVHTQPLQWMLYLGATVIFLPLYFWAWWLRGGKLLCVMAAFFVIGTSLASWNPCSCMFLVYGVSFTGRVGSLRANVRTWIALLVVIGLESWIFRFPSVFWVPATLVAAFLGVAVIYQSEKQKVNKRLAMAQGEVTRMAQIAERERIARDLHDLLGHTLSVIVLKSELAARIGEHDTARALQEIRDVERISRQALMEVREAVSGYRSSGVAAEVTHAREALAIAGIAFDCQVAGTALPATHENVVAFAIREAVTNIVRHSEASLCKLRLSTHAGEGVELEISDDGRGDSSAEGCGLAGMRERVEALGGSMRRETAQGTHIRIWIPMPAEAVSGAA